MTTSPSTNPPTFETPQQVLAALGREGYQEASGSMTARDHYPVTEGLSDAAKASLARFQEVMPTSEPVGRKGLPDTPEWCLLICQNGEFPVLRVYEGPDDIAKTIRQMEGQDVAVFPFYGVPLEFTKGPLRLLFLPDGRAVPVFDVSAVGHMVVNIDTANVEIEKSGFLGHPALAEAVPDDVVEYDDDALDGPPEVADEDVDEDGFDDDDGDGDEAELEEQDDLPPLPDDDDFDDD